MTDLQFKPGQKIRVKHKDALGIVTVHDGEIVNYLKGNVYRVTFGGYGVRFLIPATEIENAQDEQSDKAVVETKSQDAGHQG